MLNQKVYKDYSFYHINIFNNVFEFDKNIIKLKYKTIHKYNGYNLITLNSYELLKVK